MEKGKLRRLLTDAWLSFVVLAGLEYTFHLDAIEDVPVFSSESLYLPRGTHLRQWGIVDSADSPLYSVWYYLFSFFVSDPVRLYVVNHALLIVGTTGLLYLLLRALRTSPILAVLGSTMYLVSSAPLATPLNGLFALFIMLVFLNWAMRCSSEENAFTVAAVGALLMTYVRAEYLAALVLFLVWLAIHDYRSGRPLFRASRIARIGAVLLLAAVAFVALGNPIGTGKSWLAFCNWYFQRQILSNGLQVNGTTGLQFPWSCTVVAEATFGHAQSVLAVAVRNPAAYAGFVLHNSVTYLLASSLVPFVAPFPFLQPRVQAVLSWFELLLVAGAIWLVAKAGSRGVRGSLGAALPTRFLVCAAVCFGANVLAAVLFFPKWYYLLPQTALLICCLFAVLSSTMGPPILHRTSLRTASAIGFLLVVVVPNHVYGWLPPFSTGGALRRDPSADGRILGRRLEWAIPVWSALGQSWSGKEFNLGSNPLQEYRPHQLLANRITLEAIRSLSLTSPVNIWGAGSYAAFLPGNYQDVGWWIGRPASLLAYLNERQMNMVVWSYLMDIYYGNAPEFQALTRDPERYGFIRRDIPGSTEILLIKRSLLQEGAPAARLATDAEATTKRQ